MIEQLINWIHRAVGWSPDYPLWLNLLRMTLIGGAWLFVVFLVALAVFIGV